MRTVLRAGSAVGVVRGPREVPDPGAAPAEGGDGGPERVRREDPARARRELLMTGPGRGSRTPRSSGRRRQARRTGTKAPPKVIKPVPAAGSKRVWKLVDQIRETGVQDSTSHSDDAIEQLIADVGERSAERLLKEQLESTRRYIEGHLQPGNKRWFAREERWNRLTRQNEEYAFDEERDSYFYYHGKK